MNSFQLIMVALDMMCNHGENSNHKYSEVIDYDFSQLTNEEKTMMINFDENYKQSLTEPLG